MEPPYCCGEIKIVEKLNSWKFPAPPVSAPTVILSGGGSSRTAIVYSSDEAEWEITFNTEVTYILQNVAGDDLLDKQGKVQEITFPGSVTCNFKATNSTTDISLPVKVGVTPPYQTVKVLDGNLQLGLNPASFFYFFDKSLPCPLHFNLDRRK